MAMGVPGWPELACCTASIARLRRQPAQLSPKVSKLGKAPRISQIWIGNENYGSLFRFMPWKMQERYRMVTHCVKNEDMDEYNSYQQWKCDL